MVRAFLLFGALVSANGALAAEPEVERARPTAAGGAIRTGDGHGIEVDAGHAVPEGHEDGHATDGHDAGHHVTVTGDDDHDGVANWRDSDSEAYSLVKLASQAVSLLIVLGIFFVYARPAIRDFVSNRALAARKVLTDSAHARDQAQASYSGLESRLASLEAEVTRIASDAQADAAGEEAKLVARATEEGQRIGAVAERKIRDEVNRARVALRTEAVDLAVKLAENTLRSAIGSSDQQRLAREFLDSLKKDEAGLHG